MIFFFSPNWFAWNILKICSLNFIECAKLKLNTTNMDLQFVVTIQFLVQWWTNLTFKFHPFLNYLIRSLLGILFVQLRETICPPIFSICFFVYFVTMLLCNFVLRQFSQILENCETLRNLRKATHSFIHLQSNSMFFIFFQPEFYQVCHTKAEYDEFGPSICRYNPAFGSMLDWFGAIRKKMPSSINLSFIWATSFLSFFTKKQNLVIVNLQDFKWYKKWKVQNRVGTLSTIKLWWCISPFFQQQSTQSRGFLRPQHSIRMHQES